MCHVRWLILFCTHIVIVLSSFNNHLYMYCIGSVRNFWLCLNFCLKKIKSRIAFNLTIIFQMFSVKHSSFFSRKNRPKIRMCEQILLLLTCLSSQTDIVINLLFTCIFISCLLRLFSFDLVSQSLATGHDLPLTSIKYLYLWYVLLSALTSCSAELRPQAGGRLWPRTEAVSRSSAANVSAQSVNSLTEQELILMTIWVKIWGPTDCLKSLNLSPAAAGGLTPP